MIQHEAARIAETGAALAAEEREPTHFQVDQTFNVRGVGTVLSGTVVSGSIGAGQSLMLGPTSAGAFADVTVTGIQRAQVRRTACHPVRLAGIRGPWSGHPRLPEPGASRGGPSCVSAHA